MEEFIKKAFDKAEEETAEAERVSLRIDAWLEQNMKGILDAWMSGYSLDQGMRVIKIMNSDLSEMFFYLCRSFAIAGYLFGLQDKEINK